MSHQPTTSHPYAQHSINVEEQASGTLQHEHATAPTHSLPNAHANTARTHPQLHARPADAHSDDAAARIANFVFVGTFGKVRALEICEGTSSKPNAALTASYEVHTAWTAELEGCGHHMVHIKLCVSRRIVYAATNGHIFCFDALNGKQVWRSKSLLQTGAYPSDLVTLLLTRDESTLVSASNGAIVAFNSHTGNMKWHASTSESTHMFALVEHNKILYAGNKGHVYAYDLANGNVKWEISLKSRLFPVSLAIYSFIPHGEKDSYHLLLAGIGGYVYVLDGNNGSRRSKINLEGAGYKPVALLVDSANDILITATSGELRCFKVNTMTQLWKSDLPGLGYSIGHSLLFSDRDTILLGMRGHIAAINKSNNKIEWHTSLPGCGYNLVTVGAMDDTNVFVCGSSGKLYGIDKTGRILWSDGLSGLGFSPISISTTTFDTDFNSTTLPQYIEASRQAT